MEILQKNIKKGEKNKHTKYRGIYIYIERENFKFQGKSSRKSETNYSVVCSLNLFSSRRR